MEAEDLEFGCEVDGAQVDAVGYGEDDRGEAHDRHDPGVDETVNLSGCYYCDASVGGDVLLIRYQQAEGWTVKRRQFGGRYDYITDPSDTTRLQLRERALHVQARWFDRDRWPWNSITRSLGGIKDFAAELDRRVPALVKAAAPSRT